MVQEDPALERARKYVTEVRDFYYHLMVYVLVNAMLVVIDRLGGANSGFLGLDFAYWVIIGWGFGVAGHAISVFFGEYRVQKLYEKETARETTSR
jgi:hypothetical protein